LIRYIRICTCNIISGSCTQTILTNCKKKNKTHKVIRHAVGSQLGFLKRNLNSINKLLERPWALQNHVSPGERNLIEGKFGQAKTAYGLNRIKARLRTTSESWIASIILVLNLVKLAGGGTPLPLNRNNKSLYSKDCLQTCK